MPWREVSVVDQRAEFVALALLPGANVSELCQRFGVSRSNGYKWLARHAQEGPAGLLGRSRRPSSSPIRTAELVEAEILRVRAESNEAWGGRKIARVLEREGRVRPVPAASTITEVLRRHGRLVGRAKEHPGPWQRFERDHPNELWQMDFKGHFGLPGGRCHPLTVIDDHSRYALGVQACGDEQDRTVRDRLRAIFRRYGLPFSMLMDNGSPWGDAGGQPWTAFGVWLTRLGIRVVHGRPFHPQTQGKDERFHRSLKAEALDGKSFSGLAQCQRAFDDWRHIYNYRRPHEAIGMAVPAERYRPSPRCFPETLPPIEYGSGDLVRKVDAAGLISFKGLSWRIGKPFIGLPVALRPTQQDGIYQVRFCAHTIASLDLHARRCGNLENQKPAGHQI